MGDEATSGQAFQWALTNGDIEQVKTCINEVNRNGARYPTQGRGQVPTCRVTTDTSVPVSLGLGISRVTLTD